LRTKRAPSQLNNNNKNDTSEISLFSILLFNQGEGILIIKPLDSFFFFYFFGYLTPKGKPVIDNPEAQATLGTRQRTKTNRTIAFTVLVLFTFMFHSTPTACGVVSAIFIT
jgi:hypothetical protein